MLKKALNSDKVLYIDEKNGSQETWGDLFLENMKKYKISFCGEFVDNELEKEYLEYDMKRYAKAVGPVALIFGVIYMMFLLADYVAIKNSYSFIIILLFRSLVLVLSVVLYVAVKKINKKIN